MPDARPSTTPTGDERTMLRSFLTYVRAVAVSKPADLPLGVGGRADLVTGLTLLGIISHLTHVERWWFQHIFAGRDIDLPWSDSDPDADFRVPEGATHETVVAAYRAATTESDSILAAADLDAIAARPSRGGPVSMRWIGWHLVEETARHNGHLDLLRQRLDGRTGEF